MSEGGTRAQLAILTYMYKHSSFEDAYTMILKMKIPEENLPSNLKFSDQLVESVKKRVTEQ